MATGAGKRSQGSDRFRGGADGLLCRPDGVTLVRQWTQAAHVNIPVERQRTQTAGCYQEGKRGGEPVTVESTSSMAIRAYDGLDAEKRSVADVRSGRAGEVSKFAARCQ